MVRDLRRFPGFERMERLSLFLVHVYRRHEAGLDHVFYPEEDLKKRAVDELPGQGHMTNANSRWVAIMCVWLFALLSRQHSCLFCSFVLKRIGVSHFVLKNMAYDTPKCEEWCWQCADTARNPLRCRFNVMKNLHGYIDVLFKGDYTSFRLKGSIEMFHVKIYNYL